MGISQDPDFKSDLKKISSYGSMIAALVTVLTVGIQPGILKILHLEDAVELGNLFFRTMPLTVSVMIIAIALRVDRIKLSGTSIHYIGEEHKKQPEGQISTAKKHGCFLGSILHVVKHIGATIAATVACFLFYLYLRAIALIGEMFGGIHIVEPKGGNPRGYWLDVLMQYYRAYTAPVFVSSIVLGIFLGWTWRKLAFHALKSK